MQELAERLCQLSMTGKYTVCECVCMSVCVREKGGEDSMSQESPLLFKASVTYPVLALRKSVIYNVLFHFFLSHT